MCGFGGRWSGDGTTPSRELLTRMARSLTHRGPDGEGIWRDEGVGLAHRRLAVIDQEGGLQPMVSADEETVLVYNGEIFNFQALRSELVGRGHTFRTRSDTEVVLEGYRAWGEELPARLVGQFAFMVWDRRRRRLFGARDRLGQKPLYWATRGGDSARDLWFGSEIKALLMDPELSREPDWRAADAFLRWGYVPGSRTTFRGIQEVPPAHLLVADEGRPVRVRPYWSPVEGADGDHPDPAALHAELAESIREAVSARRVADVPLGAFLSGGLDSSLVTAHLAEQGPVRTFSVGFAEEGYDESPIAARVARHLGTEHTDMTVRPDAAAVLPAMAWHFDEPFADASAVPVWYLSRETRRDVTVALSGDGGDEVFAGYGRYGPPGGLRRWQAVPRPLRVLLDALLGPMGNRLASTSLPARAVGFNRRSLLAPEDFFLHYHEKGDWHRPRDVVYGERFRSALAPEAGSDDSGPLPGVAEALRGLHRGDPVLRMQLADLLTYLPDDINVKVDRMSMAHSLEVRSPFLDHRVAERALRLPLSDRVGDGRSRKVFLRNLARDRLPDDILQRPKKGFTVPLERWFRGELRPAALRLAEGSALARDGWLEASALRTVVAEHLAGTTDWGGRLWMLMNLELWYRLRVRATPRPTPPDAGLMEVLDG